MRKGFFDAAYWVLWVSQVALVVKHWPVSAGDLRDAGLIPGSGRSPGGGHGNPLQYSYLENPMDRGAWRATVQGATVSVTTKGTWRACTGCPPRENMRFFISPKTEDILSIVILQGQNLPTSGGNFCFQVRVIEPVLRGCSTSLPLMGRVVPAK